MVEPRIWPWLDAAAEQEWTATPATELQLYSRNALDMIGTSLSGTSNKSFVFYSYYIRHFFTSCRGC